MNGKLPSTDMEDDLNHPVGVFHGGHVGKTMANTIHDWKIYGVLWFLFGMHPDMVNVVAAWAKFKWYPFQIVS